MGANQDPRATATVNLEQLVTGFGVTRIESDVGAAVPRASAETFERLATQAKATCPISRALAGTEITLSARSSADIELV